MRYTVTQVIYAISILSILCSLILLALSTYLGISGNVFFFSLPLFLIFFAVSHILLREYVQDKLVVYNRSLMRYYVVRWGLLVGCLVLTILIAIAASANTGSSYGGAMVIIYAMFLLFGVYYLYIIIETIVQFIKKNYQKAYINIQVLICSVLIFLLIN